MTPSVNRQALAIILLFALVTLALAGCSSKETPQTEAIKNSQFKIDRVPQSCTKRKEYPQTVRTCRKSVCAGLPAAHCKGGLDDKASASLISCIKENLKLNGADHDDCRLFVYDLKSAIGSKS